MGSVDVLREITPLSPEDCFLVMQRPKRSFSYPLHVHPEFELNYLENAAGAIRIVGDSVEEMEELDLLLVAGGAKHAYSNHKCLSTDILEITIQFHASLFDSFRFFVTFGAVKYANRLYLWSQPAYLRE